MGIVRLPEDENQTLACLVPATTNSESALVHLPSVIIAMLRGYCWIYCRSR
jgi:hypothetical protein